MKRWEMPACVTAAAVRACRCWGWCPGLASVWPHPQGGVQGWGSSCSPPSPASSQGSEAPHTAKSEMCNFCKICLLLAFNHRTSFSTSSQIKTQENSIKFNAGLRQISGQRLLCSASPPPPMVSQGMTIPGVASTCLPATGSHLIWDLWLVISVLNLGSVWFPNAELSLKRIGAQ